MKSNKKEWDFIVVGTGPSGATIAKELSKKNKNVLILEKGKYDLSINIPRMLRNREMMFTGKGRTLVRGIRQGGTSVLYYGTASDPPQDLFK
jgi:choline dehydrogenase-like flavoprotein